MTRRCQRRRVRHLAAGHERERCGGRDPEQLLEPLSARLFDHRFCGSACIDGRILIPGRRQPVGGKGGRERTANYPAKETPTGRAEQSVLDVVDERINDLLGWYARFRERRNERSSQFGKTGTGSDGAVI